MTLRSFILGLAGAIVICTLTYINDFVLRQTYLVGNHLPVSIYGTLIIFLVLNMALYRVWKRLALTGRELVIILAMTLTACCIPSSGLLRTFTSVLMMTHFRNKMEPGWQKNRVISEVVPEKMLVDIRKKVLETTVEQVKGDTAILKDALPGDFASLDQPMLHIYLHDGTVRKVRRIVAYDPKTKTCKLDTAIGSGVIIPDGSPCKVTVNNEDRVLTPFLQGEKRNTVDKLTVPYSAQTMTISKEAMTLPPGAPAVDGYFEGMKVEFRGGLLNGVVTSIAKYEGASRKVVFAAPLAQEPIPPVSFEITDPQDSGFIFSVKDIDTKVVAAGKDFIRLGPIISSVNDCLTDTYVEFLDPPLAGQKFLVVDYAGSQRKLVFARPLGAEVKPGSRVRISSRARPASYQGQGKV
ncbi:MAG: hypothetical protein D6820_06895, partial [Lentisphaerae bacterium]